MLGLLRDANYDFPSFSEGLSLRPTMTCCTNRVVFNFPSFSEGLSLRRTSSSSSFLLHLISLPFRRDFH